jgi:hypothetical protein
MVEKKNYTENYRLINKNAEMNSTSPDGVSRNDTNTLNIRHYLGTRKSLKISKGQSESVYRRRTDKAMTKRKSTKGQTTINKAYK